MSVGNVDGSMAVDVKLQVTSNGVFNNRTIQDGDGIGIQNKAVTTQQTQTAKLDSRSAVIDKGSIDNIHEQIDYNRNHSIKSFFGGVANKIKKVLFSKVTDKKEFKATAPTLNTMLKGGVDGKLKPLKTWLQQDIDGSYSFMMQIKNVVNNAAVNEKIEALYAEAEKAAKNSDGNIQFDGKTLTIDGKKINLPVKGYPENYIMFTASNMTDGEGKSKVTLVIPNTAESKKKFTEMSKSADEQLKILENIKKLYAEDSQERAAIENFGKYKTELENILKKFSDKTDKQNSSDKTEQEPINFNINSMPDAEIISGILNSAEVMGVTTEKPIYANAKTIGEVFDQKFTDFTQNEDNKIAGSNFNTNTNTNTATVNTDKHLAGNTCILHQITEGQYALYIYNAKDGKFTKATFKAANGETEQSKINHHIFARLGELRSSGTEILLAKQGTNELYTMGHGKELDLMITGKSADGFTANISGKGVDKLQGSPEQKVVAALAETYSNLVKSGTKIDDLAKAKLEVAAMMIANREKYGNFAGADKADNQAKFIKDIVKPKYKKPLSKEDYGKLEKFVTTTMADKFAAGTGEITTALAAIEKGDKGEVEITGISGLWQQYKSLTISFAASAASKELTEKVASLTTKLTATKINGKAINVGTTLNALTKAADPKLKKAGTNTNATAFADLSLSDKLTVLQQAQAKANLANQLVELHGKTNSTKEYIKLLGQLAKNPLLKSVKIKWENTNEMSVQELTKNFAILIGACITIADQKETFNSQTKLVEASFNGNQQAIDAIKWLESNLGAEIVKMTAINALNAFIKFLNVDALFVVQKIETGCKTFPGIISKAICNAQLVGLTLQ